MSELSSTVVEAHEGLFELFLVDDAPFAARNGPMEIYHRFHTWPKPRGTTNRGTGC